MPDTEPQLRDLLRLTLTNGLGPVLIARLLETFGTPDRVLAASASQLERVRGIGPGRSVAIVRGMKDSASLVDEELRLAARLGVRLIARFQSDYPPLLADIPDAPPLLYVRGDLRPHGADRYPVAIVGSRRCTHYGLEQAEHFAGVLAGAGLTIVSGGARGIDTAAHRGSLKSAGRTFAVLGCGLAACYPPENAELFDRIAGAKAGSSLTGACGGAVISELPLRSPPEAENFPARNRLISGLSLGVIVIEAGHRSGSLITARLAAEDHGREVMAVPGRVDSPASQGTLDLIKQGGAALVTEPADVLALLETPARHTHHGTHTSRYADPSEGKLFGSEIAAAAPEPVSTRSSTRGSESDSERPAFGTTPAQSCILEALDGSSLTLDQLVDKTGLTPSDLRSEITHLELRRLVLRDGPRLGRASRTPR